MQRRTWIGGVLGLALCSLAQGAPPERKTNFVVILCDDLGYGDLACFGHPTIQTPNLDKMASDGCRFTQCYSASPVCSPSRAGLFTGGNPNRYNIRDWIKEDSGIFLPTSAPTIAKLLKSAGYQTAHVGKWHLSSKMGSSEPTPSDHGFDYWFATQNNALPTHHDPINFVRNGTSTGPIEGWSSRIIVDEAIDWLKQAGDKPFFLWVCLHAPHEVVATPEEYLKLYSSQSDPTIQQYFGCVSMLDAEVGRLLATLDASGKRDDTLVLFTSDNGPEGLLRYPKAIHSHGSAKPMREQKLSMFEGGYRVPGIVRWPSKARAGSVISEAVCGLDVLPTLSEIAGVALPKDGPFDGASFLPVFDGKPVARSVPLYWQYDRATSKPLTMSLLDVGGWKLIADEKFEKPSLYRLTNDIGETKDLAAAEPERVKDLVAKMKERRTTINTP